MGGRVGATSGGTAIAVGVCPGFSLSSAAAASWRVVYSEHTRGRRDESADHRVNWFLHGAQLATQ